MAVEKRSTAQVYEQIQAGITAAVGPDMAPGGLVAALIAFLMSMLGGACPVPPVPADINTENLRREIAIDRGLIASGVRPRGKQGIALLAATKASLNTITDAEATDLIDGA